MNKKIFFQASMPRSGSTLLQNIIGQNPKFHVTPTSGIVSLIDGVLSAFAHSDDFRKEKDYNLCKSSLYNFCKEGIEGYYSNIEKPFILNKSREWLSYMNVLNKMYHSPKVVCLVRDLRSVFSSYEKQYLNNIHYSFLLLKNYNIPINSSIYDRMEFYEKSFPLDSFLKSLHNIIQFENKDNIKLIKFEDLCYNPQKTLKDIYDYLEIPSFAHNFSYINQITYENDNFSMFGEHTIKPSILLPFPNWEEYLTPEISDKIYEEYLWFFNYFNYKK